MTKWLYQDKIIKYDPVGWPLVFSIKINKYLTSHQIYDNFEFIQYNKNVDQINVN